MTPETQNLVIDTVAVLTNYIARMVVCPTCQARPPVACFADGTVHPLRIEVAEAGDEVQS